MAVFSGVTGRKWRLKRAFKGCLSRFLGRRPSEKLNRSGRQLDSWRAGGFEDYTFQCSQELFRRAFAAVWHCRPG